MPAASPRPPGRPLPPHVYRQRRLLILAIVATVVVAVVEIAHLASGSGRPTALAAAIGADKAARATASPTPTVAPTTVALDPTEFATGSCVALAPTSGNRNETVFLDAGHGGVDPGAVGTTQSGASVHEADLTLPVELDVADQLRANGYRVVVSRTTNTTVLRLSADDLTNDGQDLSLIGAHDDVAARDICANLAHASALVGIYFDAGASPTNAGSVTAYDAARPFAAANEQLATLVSNDTLASMNAHGWAIPNEGVLNDDHLGSRVPTNSTSALAAASHAYDHLLLLGPAQVGYFTTPSLMPGTLIEPLFITDPFEASIAASSAGEVAIGAGITTAIETFLNPPAVSASSSAAANASGGAAAAAG